MFTRLIYKELFNRLEEPRKFIQALFGPRQVGKTTLIQQVADKSNIPFHYATADEPTLKDRIWLLQQWETARLLAEKNGQALLILDEVQKITQWSETVKLCWDQDTRNKRQIKVAVLGSSPLLLQHGLTESLAGRFEIIPVTHWTFQEMQAAFNFTLDEYIYFGGYPGPASLIKDEGRWRQYISDSLIETTISRDILLMTRINKPALLRRLFHLGCEYSGQILSYQKMLGQLQDAGNTTTLAHYLKLLCNAGMLCGLEKYSGKTIRQKSSSPKFLVMNTALMTIHSNYNFSNIRNHPDYYGRLVESAVGAYLFNQTIGKNINLFYWREGIKEIDFILQQGKEIIGIEVKSNIKKNYASGIRTLQEKFNVQKILLVGGDGIALETFLTTPIEKLFNT